MADATSFRLLFAALCAASARLRSKSAVIESWAQGSSLTGKSRTLQDQASTFSPESCLCFQLCSNFSTSRCTSKNAALKKILILSPFASCARRCQSFPAAPAKQQQLHVQSHRAVSGLKLPQQLLSGSVGLSTSLQLAPKSSRVFNTESLHQHFFLRKCEARAAATPVPVLKTHAPSTRTSQAPPGPHAVAPSLARAMSPG